ncbi:hypothetical protein ACF0H5_008923 [Mactra antiquata]
MVLKIWLPLFTLLVRCECAIQKNKPRNVEWTCTASSLNRCQGIQNRMQEYQPMTLPDCVEKCSLKSQCQALNHHAGMSFCELFDKSDSNFTENRCTHILRHQISVIKSPCGKECGNGETCDTKSKSCVIKECLDIPRIENAKTLGNSRGVGKKVLVKCREDFIPKDGIKQTYCTENGNWEPVVECVHVGKGYAKQPKIGADPNQGVFQVS